MGPENPLIAEIRHALEEIKNIKVFLVGGSVRDLLLGQPVTDYDFLVEGEIFSFANLVGERLKCPVVLNRKLLTASCRTPWGQVDFSRARREFYRHPGALPEVSPASWQEDLQRRDFTVNTLLLPLYREGWGELLDPLDSRRDLQAGLIRILHPRSFRDDPTRILRGLRLKNRLGFAWEEETLACLTRDWPYLNLVSPVRRLKEWQLICQEKECTRILQELYLLGGWETCFGSLPYCSQSLDSLNRFLQKAEYLPVRAWFAGMLFLLETRPEAVSFAAPYWGFTPQEQQNLEDTFELLAGLAQGLFPKKRMVYRYLRKLPLESVYFLYHKEFRETADWQTFWQEIQESGVPLRGRDLLELGCQPGRELGRLLRKLEEAYWQEEYSTREEGLNLAQKLLLGGN